MDLIVDSKLSGAFTGWRGDAKYELTNGQLWTQVPSSQSYDYKFRPGAKIWQDDSRFFLSLDGVDGLVEVTQSTLQMVSDSRIVGDFNVWSGKTLFNLVNGETWQQSGDDTFNHYSYRPLAKVWIDGAQHLLDVEGAGRQIAVERV